VIKLKCERVSTLLLANGIALKRGCTELVITGTQAAETVQRLLAATEMEITVEEICLLFPPHQHKTIKNLIEQLVTRHILVPAGEIKSVAETNESIVDIFYWHFEGSSVRIRDHIKNQQIMILGVNYISRQLASSLLSSGFENVKVLDDPTLRQNRLFDQQGKLHEWPASLEMPVEFTPWKKTADLATLSCIVATSDVGSTKSLLKWNRYCVEHSCRFMPVMLHNLIGFVGPLVIPGETACYECAYARQNSHVEQPEIHTVTEALANEGEAQSVIGFHPSMASILGDLAAFELTKFYSGAIPGQNIGKLIEVNLLATQLVSRKTLKVPRCMVCSPLNTKPSMNTRKLQPPKMIKGTNDRL